MYAADSDQAAAGQWRPESPQQTRDGWFWSRLVVGGMRLAGYVAETVVRRTEFIPFLVPVDALQRNEFRSTFASRSAS